MNKRCLICLKRGGEESVEHIIPQSLGNLHYLLPKGEVCKKCNSLLAKYENKVVSSRIFRHYRNGHNGKYLHPVEIDTKAVEIFLWKIAIEAMYRSQYSLYSKYDFSAGRDFLFRNIEMERKFNIREKVEMKDYKAIPDFINRWRLKMIGVKLLYTENDGKLIIKLIYKGLEMTRTIAQKKEKPDKNVRLP